MKSKKIEYHFQKPQIIFWNLKNFKIILKLWWNVQWLVHHTAYNIYHISYTIHKYITYNTLYFAYVSNGFSSHLVCEYEEFNDKPFIQVGSKRQDKPCGIYKILMQ